MYTISNNGSKHAYFSYYILSKTSTFILSILYTITADHDQNKTRIKTVSTTPTQNDRKLDSEKRRTLEQIKLVFITKSINFFLLTFIITYSVTPYGV